MAIECNCCNTIRRDPSECMVYQDITYCSNCFLSLLYVFAEEGFITLDHSKMEQIGTVITR